MKKNCMLSIVAILGIAMVLFAPQEVMAAPVNTAPMVVQQPDGKDLAIYRRGDEKFDYTMTSDGFLVNQNEAGYWVYLQAAPGGNKCLNSVVVAHNPAERTMEEQAFLTTIPANLLEIYKKAVFSARASVRSIQKVGEIKSNAYPRTGSPKGLVILTQFTDLKFVVYKPQETFTNLLNEEGYIMNESVGSAKDYYKAASKGTFSPDFEVFGPVTLSRNFAYYGADQGGIRDVYNNTMILETCDSAVAHGLDLSRYDENNDGIVDLVFIFYAGRAQSDVTGSGSTNLIWPKAGTIGANPNDAPVIGGKKIYNFACASELRGPGTTAASICGIGTFTHEFAHVLGFPDYYYTGAPDNAIPTLDYWSIMDQGTHLNEGRTPPMFSSYDRFFEGWHTPTVVPATPANIRIDPITTKDTSFLFSAAPYNMNPLTEQEIFILENRQQQSWDRKLPGHGLLAWHIKYNQAKWDANTPNNTVPQCMRIEVADTNPLAANPYPGSKNITAKTFEFRDNSGVNIPITNITEVNGIIFLKYKGGVADALSVVQDSVKYTAYQNLTKTVDVTSSIIWNAATSDTWIKMNDSLVSNYTGVMNEKLKITVYANSTGAVRNGKIVFTAGALKDTVYIQQTPTTDNYLITNFDTVVLSGANGAAVNVMVETSAASWNAASNQSWINLVPSTSSLATTKMSIESNKLNATAERYAMITITAQGGLTKNIVVKQIPGPAETAVVVSLEPDTIGVTIARLKGVVTYSGGVPVLGCGVIYGTNSLVSEDVKIVQGSLGNNDTIYTDIAGLAPNTTYYYKTFVITKAGEQKSAIISNFKTTAGTKPVVAAKDPISIQVVSASLSGVVKNFGGAPVTLCGVYYGTATFPPTRQSRWYEGHIENDTNIVVNMQGLQSNTKYYYRIFAITAVGEGISSEIIEFTTEKGAKATISTIDPINIEPRTVTLRGLVINDGGAPITERGFYMTQTPNPTAYSAGVMIVNDGGLLGDTIYGQVLDATPATKYYFRTYAINVLGTASAPQVIEFTTPIEVSVANEIADRIEVYPNPTHDKVMVNLGQLNIKRIDISNNAGNIIKRVPKSQIKDQIEISLSAFANGIYYLNIYTDNDVLVKQVIKQ